MNVGVLTFHRATNYGAVLQCYALQQTLLNFGVTCDVVDYRCDFIENHISKCGLRYYLSHPRMLIHGCKVKNLRYDKRKIFRQFLKNNIVLWRYMVIVHLLSHEIITSVLNI